MDKQKQGRKKADKEGRNKGKYSPATAARNAELNHERHERTMAKRHEKSLRRQAKAEGFIAQPQPEVIEEPVVTGTLQDVLCKTAKGTQILIEAKQALYDSDYMVVAKRCNDAVAVLRDSYVLDVDQLAADAKLREIARNDIPALNNIVAELRYSKVDVKAYLNVYKALLGRAPAFVPTRILKTEDQHMLGPIVDDIKVIEALGAVEHVVGASAPSPDAAVDGQVTDAFSSESGKIVLPKKAKKARAKKMIDPEAAAIIARILSRQQTKAIA